MSDTAKAVAMTPEEGRALARFLGEPYQHISQDDWVSRDWERIYPNDLLIILLEKAAEFGLEPWLWHVNNEWDCTLELSRKTGPTPLAALTAAVVAYQGSKP